MTPEVTDTDRTELSFVTESCGTPQSGPLITIGVSTYNRKDYLRESLQSLQRQTLQDFEIIVVDDGSTDDTREMVRTEFPEVRYIYQPNSGDAAAIAANGLEGFRRDTTWSPMAEAVVGPNGDPDSLQYIPYGNGATFELEKTIHVGRSGVTQNVMECRAPYAVYLQGLNSREIYNLIDAAEKQVRFPGLKIGDLTTPNNNAGNWE